MKKIILISGKAEHGKDTVADYIKEQLLNLNQKTVIDRFAKYIKGYLKDYYGWDGITKDKKHRDFLQVLGSDEIKERLNYKCFHAKRLAEDFQINEKYIDYFLASDTRYKDEIYIMKAMFPNDIVTIRVNRENHISKLTKEQLVHNSETDLDDFKFDYYLNNNGDLSGLHRQIDYLLEEIIMDN